MYFFSHAWSQILWWGRFNRDSAKQVKTGRMSCPFFGPHCLCFDPLPFFKLKCAFFKFWRTVFQRFFLQFQSEYANAPYIWHTKRVPIVISLRTYLMTETGFIAIMCESGWQKASAHLIKKPDLSLWSLIGIACQCQTGFC